MKRFTKEAFDLPAMVEVATDLKYTREIKRVLDQQLKEPPDDFVRLLVSDVYSGRMTQSAKETFKRLAKEAINQFIYDQINVRLKSAMATDDGNGVSQGAEEAAAAEPAEGGDVVTTDDELQGFYIVKAMLHDSVDVKRIFMRDVRTYCGILLDDNNRKPICRLRFNTAQRYLGIFNKDRNEERVPIEDVDDLYQHADSLKATVSEYLSSED